jgi:RHS repeat-associated protein
MGAQTRSFTYATSRGWLLTETHPESGTTTYTYTTEGLLDTRRDANGVTARYQYDNVHRLTGIRYDPNTFNDVTYAYDTAQVGKLYRASKMSSDGTYATEEHTYTSYDAVGRVLSETYGHRDSNIPSPTFTLTADYQYNKLGNFTQILYPTSSGRRRLDLSYNQMGRQTKIHNYYGVQGGVSPDFDVVNSLSYNAGGIVSSFNYGNNMTECRSYNTRRQMAGQKLYTSLVDCANPGTATTALDYTYNYPSANNGRLQSMVDNLDATKTQTFTYDSLNRLSQSTLGTTTTLTFAYDAYGNRTAQTATPSGPTVNLQYDTNNHITTTGYGYDPSGNGNLTNAPNATVYNYDQANRLLSVTVNSTTLGQYAYDGLGRRISKITPANNTQTFYFNTQVGMLGEYQRTAGTTQTPALVKEYVYLGKTVVATMENSGSTRKYYHTGRLASTRKVTDAWGAVLETHDYYPFGEEVVDLGDNNKPKFTGYYRDSETKIDYARNRYDNSSIGRFLTADPYRDRNAQNNPQLWNKYVYVGNDPINLVDPTGNLTCYWGEDFNERWYLIGCYDMNPGPLVLVMHGGGGGDRGRFDTCHKKHLPDVPLAMYQINLVISIANEMKIPPELLAMTWFRETQFDLNPPNNSNANGTIDIGPMQINYNPSTGQVTNVSDGSRRDVPTEFYNSLGDPLGTNLSAGQVFNGDPVDNIRLGAKLLQRLRDHFGTARAAFRHYNYNEPGRQRFWDENQQKWTDFFKCLAFPGSGVVPP